MANNTVEVWLEIDNTNRRVLTIPLGTCTLFFNIFSYLVVLPRLYNMPQ